MRTDPQATQPDLFSRGTMTEHDWLASADPAAMLAHVRDRATERQLRFLHDACSMPGSLVNRYIREPEKGAAILRCIFGNPFRYVHEQHRFADLVDLLAWNDRTIPRLAASVYERECPKCKGGWIVSRVRDEDGEYSRTSRARCLQCRGTGRLTDPDWSLLPIIADALEEAGCASEELLMHLRGQERCDCNGTGMHRYYPDLRGEPNYSDSIKCRCRATGWRPMPNGHVRGCWAVELLLAKEVIGC